MAKLWIETNYENDLRAVFASHFGLGKRPRVELVSQEKMVARAEANPKSQTVQAVFPSTEPGPSQTSQTRMLKRVGLNPDFSFSTFVVGESNRFAHAACRAVSEGSFGGYNPLFVHGKPGLGKTHLMSALGRQFLAENPNAKIAYVTAETFTNEFINALRTDGLERFRRRYRSLDMLLLDEVQFFQGKERSQDEFFHTFNFLLNAQTRIILSSDQPAAEIQTFDPRIISRFESGLTVAIQPPGFETRVAILRRKMELWNIELDELLVNHIAKVIKSNVRRLEGAMTTVTGHCFLNARPMTIPEVDEVLAEMIRDEASPNVSVAKIQEEVADYFGITLDEMYGRKRTNRIAFPRQVGMFLCRELTRSSLVEVGTAFGRRDHGTVIHACKRVKALSASDPGVASDLAKLRSRLGQ